MFPVASCGEEGAKAPSEWRPGRAKRPGMHRDRLAAEGADLVPCQQL